MDLQVPPAETLVAATAAAGSREKTNENNRALVSVGVIRIARD